MSCSQSSLISTLTYSQNPLRYEKNYKQVPQFVDSISLLPNVPLTLLRLSGYACQQVIHTVTLSFLFPFALLLFHIQTAEAAIDDQQHGYHAGGHP